MSVRTGSDDLGDSAGDWSGVGVLGPEAFPPAPFLAKLAEYGAPHGVLELPA